MGRSDAWPVFFLGEERVDCEGNVRSFEHNHIRHQRIRPELVGTIRQIGMYQGKEDLYAQQSPEVLESLRQVALVQSTESSCRIEGVTVPANRFGELMADKTRPRDRSEQEVAGYRYVLDQIHVGHSGMGVSPRLILQMHRDLYQFVPQQGGKWKNKDNRIVERSPNGRMQLRFQPVSAVGTPQHMKELCRLYRKEANASAIDPLLLIPAFALDFLCVHPFTDGNGRMARLLTLLLLYQSGFNVGRYVSLERVIEDSKESYYEALLRSSRGWHESEHDLAPWWGYWTGTVLAAYREFADRLGKIASGRGAKAEMVGTVIDRLPGRFRISQIEALCPGVSRETVRKVLNRLKSEQKVACIRRGPDAEWAKLG
ncbi:MAG: Fic family protein [Phycisphaerae bacterium]|nr:Fic family protein [Phycisphaerae bacterium]